MTFARLSAHPPAWLGRRGATLVLFGLVWIMVGISVPINDMGSPTSWVLLHQRLPLVVREALWIGTGIAAILGGTVERPKWEQVGFSALLVAPIIRAGSFAWSWGVSIFTDYGYSRGWTDAVTWGVILLVILLLAGWPEANRESRVTTAERT